MYAGLKDKYIISQAFLQMLKIIWLWLRKKKKRKEIDTFTDDKCVCVGGGGSDNLEVLKPSKHH